ncbi:helix-turn-helix domain-containing protein [Maledivibacter halophilus]|uniref:DNA-binding transcriptional regulator, XRE-family HTH domain n=1 Tax=Maledivibacter halophilus TaxID=36842 RepID=A0A1T5MW64_9FIRM|nr:helix-turn-helix transcriptional regulator [Maledivibacter halophilus]SKC92314.1 DNA-binding transcriptional regulator, XRE-family HTH domain [Maledivibacter halophilus]
MSLSIRLQELRKKANLSQEELAEKLELSRQAISKWESEQSKPDINNIIKLSEIYNVSTDYILKGPEMADNLENDVRQENDTILGGTNRKFVHGIIWYILGIFGMASLYILIRYTF